MRQTKRAVSRLTRGSRKSTLVQSIGWVFNRWGGILPLIALALACFVHPSTAHAQVTATLTGTVQDASGGVIPGAEVTLINDATGETRKVETNGAGLYAFPSLTPGTFDIRATAKGFQSTVVTGIVLNAGDTRDVPALSLTVGAQSQTITVSATSEMIPVENGQHVDVLSSKDIDNLALEGQDTSELLRVLPGTVTTSSSLTNTSPTFSDLNITVDEASIGSGMYTNGSIYRGGTSILVDGAQTIDIGDMASSLVIVEPEMTAQVSVQSSNMSADQPFGPVVVSTISKSGTQNYHGDGFFDARNNVLNANGWQQNHNNTPLGPAHDYYPGGSAGGPIPGTHKHLLFWGGYEKWLQNEGNSNVAESYIPSPEMMAGDFSEDNADNQALCPNGFYAGKPPSGIGAGSWCNDLGGTTFAAGTVTAAAAASNTLAAYGSSGNDFGQKFPMGTTFLDPGAAALAKIWPKATSSTPLTVCGGCNYYQPVQSTPNGWIYRLRVDYLLGDNTKIYGSYEQARSSNLAGSPAIGAHLYWTPGNSIPLPGGGETEQNYGKVLAGHIVHNFNATTTNDFLAAWAFGSYPFTTANPSALYRTTNGYPANYGKVFSSKSLNLPAYNSAGNETFPDFSQDSIFENPPGEYAVKKEAPQFADTFTKVWGTHTIKIGGFTQTTDNYQSSFSYYEDGDMQFSAGQHPDLVNPGNGNIGSQFNSVAQFANGLVNSYTEQNSAPIGDVAELNTAAFVDDTFKATRRMTLELGIRLEHVGHWYDRDKVGLAVFEPGKVLSDYYAGNYAPGFSWHAINPGIPLSGQPNRFAYADPRFGVSYDLFGTGNTVIRGGWGVYRYVTQVNTVANGEAQGTADHVLTYNQPGQSEVQMRDISSLAYVACPSATKPPPCGTQGGQTGLDAADYGQPMTQAYNLTIDQRLPWNTQLEVAYVGSQSSQLVDGGEDIEGSSYTEVSNQNKTPIGALFAPDPVTGVLSTNPENVAQNPNGTGATATGNKLQDYHPFGYAYGTAGVFMLQNTAWANYNGLQASWTKTTGRLTFDLNGTWSKMLGTTLQENPYVEGQNYGPTAQDRPLVFNTSYTYSSGTLHYANNILNQAGSGWTISGITTWQAGGYIPAFLGNGVPNYGNGSATIEQYTGLPATAAAEGINSSLGDPTYFGTDESIPIMPVLTCNPTSGLASHQVLNGACFNLPAVGTQGGQKYPYMRMTPFFNSDLALYRTFHIHENQNVQLRFSAFDWLNHSLLTFASASSYTVNYNVNYASKAISPNYNNGTAATSSLGPLFGLMTVRSALPYARVLELDLKYSF
jgi:Carboxypeptidase regulatory-like domain